MMDPKLHREGSEERKRLTDGKEVEDVADGRST